VKLCHINRRGPVFLRHTVDQHIYAWAPAGVGKGDTCPDLENVKGLDSLQLPRSGRHKKNQNVTRQVLQVQNISKCVCGWAVPRTPLGNLTVLPQISHLQLSLF